MTISPCPAQPKRAISKLPILKKTVEPPVKSDTASQITGETKFGYIENCTLALAKQQIADGLRDRYVESDHWGRCNHVACPACGIFPVWNWTKRHRLKGAVIGDFTVDFVLTWPDLDVHSDSVAATIRFLEVAFQLRDALDAGLIRGIDGYILATEYNPVPHGGLGKFQLHVHLSILPGKRSDIYILKAANKFWRANGGNKTKFRVPDCNGISGAIAYLKKPPFSGFNVNERLKLRTCVLNKVEQILKRRAALRFIGGRALSKYGFRMIRAKANYFRFRPKMNFHEKIRHPDRTAERYCPNVHQVCPVERCSKCLSFGKRIKKIGRTSAGKQRRLCKKCRKSWNKRPVLPDKNRVWWMNYLKREIRICYQERGTIAETARILGVGKERVRKVLRRVSKTSISQAHPTHKKNSDAVPQTQTLIGCFKS